MAARKAAEVGAEKYGFDVASRLRLRIPPPAVVVPVTAADAAAVEMSDAVTVAVPLQEPAPPRDLRLWPVGKTRKAWLEEERLAAKYQELVQSGKKKSAALEELAVQLGDMPISTLKKKVFRAERRMQVGDAESERQSGGVQ